MDFSSLTVANLRDLLKAQGLGTTGKKAELVERLEAQFNPAETETDTEHQSCDVIVKGTMIQNSVPAGTDAEQIAKTQSQRNMKV
mmetsp:Transcript_23626/g.39448  ORF Transcript_23626/g.39448 Transcript_23626/m.39448 type:complete len:85 (+) Transcript_23626:356-610(+)